VIEFDLAAQRPAVWEHFTQPGLRLTSRANEVRETSQNGRRGVGTINHCMHGPHAIIEEVLGWRPFDYPTISTLLPMPDAPKAIMSYAFLEPNPGATHIEILLAKPKPKDQAFLDLCGGDNVFHCSGGDVRPPRSTFPPWASSFQSPDGSPSGSDCHLLGVASAQWTEARSTQTNRILKPNVFKMSKLIQQSHVRYL
jgi:hypothetical protein